MKRILSIAALLLLSLILVACKDNQAGEVTAEITQFDVELTSMSFTATVSDPKTEITGAITVTLYDSTGKVIKTEDIADLTVLEEYSIPGLVNTMTYTLKIYATVGRNVVVLVEKTFNLASAETMHITTPDEFFDMVNNRAGNYVLDNDIDFTGETFNSPFTSAFSGTFDGQGFALKNITFEKISSYTGVFGYVSGGVIKNVTFDNVKMGTLEAPLSMPTSTRVGIVAGYVASSTGKIENVTIINSQINYTTSSTVQAYTGGAVGEFKGNMSDVTIENTHIYVKSTSYGRIRVGGAIGFLGEEGVVKEINSGTNITVEVEGVSVKDRDININIGGVIGYHNARNVNKSVEHIISTGDITVDLDFGTSEGTTDGNYSVYVGGIAGIAYSNVNEALYSGSITLNHTGNAFESNVNKYFFVGGLYGFYGSNKASISNLRISELQSINVNVSADVELAVSQTVAEIDSEATNTFSYYGDLGLMVNGVDQSGSDVITIILTIEESFFDSEWIETWLAN